MADDIVQQALAKLEAENAEEQEEDQHEIWKDNSPFLYDFLLASDLEYTSHTIQALPGVKP